MYISKLENASNLYKVLDLRKEVFCKEQGVSIEDEIDQYDIIDDNKVLHFYLEADNIVVSTCRIINCKEYIKIGRVATKKDYRHQGLCFNLLTYVFGFLKDNNMYDINNKYFYLEAQLDAIPFYNKLGFNEYGDIFLDCNIKHIKMRK